MRDTSRSLASLVVSLVMLAALGGGLLWWFSNEVNDTGVITSKWVESHTTTCSSTDKNCTPTTTYTYLIQLDNGKVYAFFLKSRDYDRVQVGQRIKLHARGREARVGGFRLSQPYIDSFELNPRE